MADDSNGLGPMPNFPHQRKRPSKVQKPQSLNPEFTQNPKFHFLCLGCGHMHDIVSEAPTSPTSTCWR